MSEAREKGKKFLNDTDCSQHTEQSRILKNISCPNILTLLQTHSLTSLSDHAEPILPSPPPFPHPGDEPHCGPRQQWPLHSHGSSIWGQAPLCPQPTVLDPAVLFASPIWHRKTQVPGPEAIADSKTDLPKVSGMVFLIVPGSHLEFKSNSPYWGKSSLGFLSRNREFYSVYKLHAVKTL